jgi:hypothetical protein
MTLSIVYLSLLPKTVAGVILNRATEAIREIFLFLSTRIRLLG